MTKRRAPLTAYRALTRIAELIGWDGCAAIIGKSEWTLRKYADPDTEREIFLRDAMRLDLAFQRAGGDGFPLFQAYAARLDIELGAEPAGPVNILSASREAARESSEALDAALHVAAGDGDVRAAIREVGEAVEAWQGMLAKLRRL